MKSRVQIRIKALMNDVPDDILPWAYPSTRFIGGLRFHSVPNIDENIRVICEDDTLSRFTYLPFSDATINEDSLYEEIDGHTYPQPTLLKTNNGTSIYINTETDELGVLYKDETHIVLKEDHIEVSRKDKVIQLTDDGIVIDGDNKITLNSGDITIQLSDGTYRSLSSLLSALIGHFHIAPSGPTQGPMNAGDMTPLSLERS